MMYKYCNCVKRLGSGSKSELRPGSGSTTQLFACLQRALKYLHTNPARFVSRGFNWFKRTIICTVNMCHVAGGGDLMVPVHYCSPVLDRAGHHDWPSSQAAALQRLRHNVLQGKMQPSSNPSWALSKGLNYFSFWLPFRWVNQAFQKFSPCLRYFWE